MLDQGTAQLRAAGFSVAQRLPHVADLRRHQLAGALHPAVGGPGRQPAALQPARPERPPHAQPGVQARRLASGRRRCRRTTGRGRRARASTTTTRSTTAATSATAGRASATPRCPTSSRWRPCTASSSPSARGLRCSPRSTCSRATCRGRASPGSSPGTTSATARSSTASRRRSRRAAVLFGDADRARAAYGRSIEYTLRTIVSFVRRYGDDKLVLVVAGRPSARDDRHRPGRRATTCRSRSSPTTRGCCDRIAGWGWQDGMRPRPRCAGLADGRVPRPLPDRVRRAADAAVRQDDRAPFERALHHARVRGVRRGRVRRAGELHDRRRDPGAGGAGRRRPRGRGAGPVLRHRRARALPDARAGLRLPRRGRQRGRRRHRPRARAATCPAASRSRRVPPLPAGSFDVVLLLETMLAFEDKDALVREVAAALRPGGRFAFTLEEGPPLTAAERAAMPDADTVWLTPLDALTRRWSGPGSPSRGARTTAARTARPRRRWRTRTPRTPSASPRRSAGGRWTSCSPPTGSGSTGWTAGGVRKLALVADAGAGRPSSAIRPAQGSQRSSLLR